MDIDVDEHVRPDVAVLTDDGAPAHVCAPPDSGPGTYCRARLDLGTAVDLRSWIDTTVHLATPYEDHLDIGVNSRLDELQAVVLAAKLRRLEEWNDERRVAAERYGDLLKGLDQVRVPEVVPGNEHVWHLYVVRVPQRDEVLARLNAAGVSAGIHYPMPIHLLPAFSGLGWGPGGFPTAERLAGEILSLPTYQVSRRHSRSVWLDISRGADVNPPERTARHVPTRERRQCAKVERSAAAQMRIAIFGLGYISAVTAAGLASQGHDLFRVVASHAGIQPGHNPQHLPGYLRPGCAFGSSSLSKEFRARHAYTRYKGAAPVQA
jgi:hypothetical protein